MSAWKILTVAAVAAWLGVMLFFSFVAAPLIFRMADRAVAALVVRTALGPYYGFGAAACGLALVGIAARGVTRRLPTLVLSLVMLGMIGAAALWVLPVADAARAAGDQGAFVRAHRLSTGLNMAAMLGCILVLVLEGVRSEPEGGRRARA